MKVLWVVNIPFGRLCELAEIKEENVSGSWLNAALDKYIDNSDIDLTVITVGRVASIKEINVKNITYCLLPGGWPHEYDYKNKSNLKNWLYIKEKYSPDIIHVWGTEFTHGYLAVKSMPDVPSVIYMQGLLKAISKYYLAGLTQKELKRSISLRDIYGREWITKKQKDLYKRSFVEAELIRLSKNIIVENDWCASYCTDIAYDCILHHCELNIRSEYFAKSWNKENMAPLTIMSNSSGYPIKGLHVLIRALKNVINEYPSTILKIPGESTPYFGKNWINKIKENGYSKYIRKLITELDLADNVVFMGRLTSEEMADQMSISNVVVIPSCIENHSSTLIEAMIVGAPCIASYVGGIPEYMKHGDNGLLYRYEEYEMLSVHIKTIFSNVEYAGFLSANARSYMREKRAPEGIKEKLLCIYKNITGL